ncbi:FCD domain-containing protein [Oscillospiraceae bacterium MB08-C2-2]|nr:FCD domain-containing protein [Oscillospiraceae bacterium MB08-C2-2]
MEGFIIFKKIGHRKVYLNILEQLKELIGQGVLSKGSKLPSERVMSEQMGVSRATIREAIRSLELIGLVRCVQGEGNYLVDELDECLLEPLSIMFSLSGSNVREVQQLRHALEVKTVELATLLATDEDVDELRNLATLIHTAPNDRSRARYDSEFHYKIAEISGNPFIWCVLKASSNLINELISGINVSVIGAETIDCQHSEIVSALEKRDAKAAARAMGEHMQFIDDYLIKRIGE